ncbi:MAG: alpha/beta hydrolase [Saprospiraceae bacterium]|nr:alpha/beta hydrolase [Saprospiraceae bacterium]
MKLTKLFLALIFLYMSNQIFAQSEIKVKESTSLIIGERIEIHSEILDEMRVLNIYLPYGYSKDSLKTYPVIYLLDGSVDEDFIHISGLVQFGSFSWINMIPESIVIGISNTDRKRDFTFPTNNQKDKDEYPTTGKSEIFIKFIEKELQPFVDKRYKTNSIKTLIGQSLGGLLASEVLFKKPELFDNYIIVSPSLWWDDESLLNDNPILYKSKKSIFIAVGKEGQVMERTAKELYDKIMLVKNENTNLYFDFLENKTHGDALHIAVYNAFEKIFKIVEK